MPVLGTKLVNVALGEVTVTGLLAVTTGGWPMANCSCACVFAPDTEAMM